MVELTLPKNSQIRHGQDLAEAGGRDQSARIPHLSLVAGRRREPAHRHLFRRHRRLRADGARRAALDQEQDRPDADAAPLLPRGHLRLLRDEHRRRATRSPAPRAWTTSRARSRSIRCRTCRWSRTWCPTSPISTPSTPRSSPGCKTVSPEPAKEWLQSHEDRAEARRALRVHPVRLLLDLVPELLVERRPLSRPGGAAAGLSLADRLAATRRPASGSTISKIRSGSIAATPS